MWASTSPGPRKCCSGRTPAVRAPPLARIRAVPQGPAPFRVATAGRATLGPASLGLTFLRAARRRRAPFLAARRGGPPFWAATAGRAPLGPTSLGPTSLGPTSLGL